MSSPPCVWTDTLFDKALVEALDCGALAMCVAVGWALCNYATSF